MTSRAFCVPGVLFLLAATVLLVITSVSLPYLPVIDFVRCHVESGNVAVADTQGTVTSTSISQLKVSDLVPDASGWTLTGGRLHSLDYGLTVPSKHLPEIVIVVPLDTLTASVFGTAAQTTRSPSNLVGLEAWLFTQSVRHRRLISTGLFRLAPPLAAAVSFIALLLSFSTHITATLLASLASFLAATITLIAFAVDIALFAFVKHRVGTLSNSTFTTNTAPAFWMTFASFILLLLAGCTVCFGRRRQTSRLDAAEPGPYTSRFGGFLSRFRRRPKY